jgi:ATP-dependent DNA helicase RecG
MGITYMRNHAICRIFREAGYLEKLGSGFLTLFKLCRENQLPIPRVIEGTGYVKCILPRPTVQFPQYSLTEQEKKVIDLFDTQEEISSKLINITLNVSRQTVTRILSSLVNKGLLVRQGSGKNMRYRKY